MYKNIFKYDDMKRAEHMAVRETVGWYLFTHQIMEVTGPDAEAFLDYVLLNNIATLVPGKDRYTVMLNDKAEIIDDVVVMRREDEKFWVSTLFSMPMDDWFYDHQGDYDVDWCDITDEWHMFSVQGPKSKEVIESLVKDSIEDLKFFTHAENEINDIPVIINRTGFTGEKWGFSKKRIPTTSKTSSGKPVNRPAAVRSLTSRSWPGRSRPRPGSTTCETSNGAILLKSTLGIASTGKKTLSEKQL